MSSRGVSHLRHGRGALAGGGDGLVTVEPLLARAPDPRELWATSLDEAAALFAIETNSMTGRPLGDAGFLAALKRRLGYPVAPGKRGPKPGKKRRIDAIKIMSP